MTGNLDRLPIVHQTSLGISILNNPQLILALYKSVIKSLRSLYVLTHIEVPPTLCFLHAVRFLYQESNLCRLACAYKNAARCQLILLLLDLLSTEFIKIKYCSCGRKNPMYSANKWFRSKSSPRWRTILTTRYSDFLTSVLMGQARFSFQSFAAQYFTECGQFWIYTCSVIRYVYLL